MRRALIIGLLCLLPLQWAWAAAAALCAHEADAGAAHVGHHAHEHHGPHGDHAAAQPPLSSDTAEGSVFEFHPDCGACHASAGTFLCSAGAVPGAWTASQRFAAYASAVVQRWPDPLFKPPSSPAA